MKKFDKLVRDKVIEFITRDGHTANHRALNNNDYKEALLEKLVEEASEVKEATDDKERIVELADVIEVIDAIKVAFKIDSGDLTRAQTRKRKERGGYEKKIFLETIDEQ